MLEMLILAPAGRRSAGCRTRREKRRRQVHPLPLVLDPDQASPRFDNQIATDTTREPIYSGIPILPSRDISHSFLDSCTTMWDRGIANPRAPRGRRCIEIVTDTT